MQVHYGRCSKPDDFMTYESAIILKDVSLTSYNLSTLIAGNPGERAMIDETASITLKEFYRIFNQNFLSVVPNTTGRVLKVTHADIEGCSGDCSEYSDGNLIWIALIDATTNDFAVTTDGGLTWSQFASGGANHTASHYDSVLIPAGSYLFWTVSDNSGTTRFYSTSLESVKGGSGGIATELTLTTTFRPKDYTVTDNYVYIVGTDESDVAGGEVWQIDKNTLAIKLIHSSSVGITAIHALDDNNIIIGNADGELYKSQVVGFFTFFDNLGSGGSAVTHIHMHDEKTLIGTSADRIYSLRIGQSSWTRYDLPAIDGDLSYISWYDNLVGYLIAGRYIYKTIDGGTTWKRIYTGFTATQSNSIAINPYNPNTFMAAYATSGTATETVKGFV